MHPQTSFKQGPEYCFFFSMFCIVYLLMYIQYLFSKHNPTKNFWENIPQSPSVIYIQNRKFACQGTFKLSYRCEQISAIKYWYEDYYRGMNTNNYTAFESVPVKFCKVHLQIWANRASDLCLDFQVKCIYMQRRESERRQKIVKFIASRMSQMMQGVILQQNTFCVIFSLE